MSLIKQGKIFDSKAKAKLFMHLYIDSTITDINCLLITQKCPLASGDFALMIEKLSLALIHGNSVTVGALCDFLAVCHIGFVYECEKAADIFVLDKCGIRKRFKVHD